MDEQPTAPPTANIAPVEIDLKCISCGYNLRTLAIDSVCPECGNSVAESFHHNWLAFADPGWLKKLRNGVTVILWLMLATVISYATFTAIMISLIVTSASPPPDFNIVILPLIALGLACTVTWWISQWMLTTPEPALSSARSSMAKWILVLSALPIAGTLAMAPTLTWLSGPVWAGGGLEMAAIVFAYAGNLASGIGFFLLLIYLRRIARRDLYKGLGKMMTFLIWGMVGAAATMLLVLVPLTWMVSRSAVVAATATTTFSGPPGQTTAAAAGYLGYTTAVTTGPAVTTQAATGPATTTMPTAVPFPPNTGLFAATMAFGVAVVVVELFVLGWGVCFVIAMFWFRKVFGRAIERNVHPASSP